MNLLVAPAGVATKRLLCDRDDTALGFNSRTVSWEAHGAGSVGDGDGGLMGHSDFQSLAEIQVEIFE